MKKLSPIPGPVAYPYTRYVFAPESVLLFTLEFSAPFKARERWLWIDGKTIYVMRFLKRDMHTVLGVFASKGTAKAFAKLNSCAKE